MQMIKYAAIRCKDLADYDIFGLQICESRSELERNGVPLIFPKRNVIN